MSKLDTVKAIALRNLAHRYPKANESEHGNDFMNGCWQGLYNFCLESGIATQSEIKQAMEDYKKPKQQRNEVYLVDSFEGLKEVGKAQ